MDAATRESHYSIGEFSRITGLTVKGLRLPVKEIQAVLAAGGTAPLPGRLVESLLHHEAELEAKIQEHARFVCCGNISRRKGKVRGW